jgi:hypothetical protein
LCGDTKCIHVPYILKYLLLRRCVMNNKWPIFLMSDNITEILLKMTLNINQSILNPEPKTCLKLFLNLKLQYSQRHTMINHCDRRITHLSDLDISFVLLNISSKFLLHLECYLLSPKRHIRINKWIKQTKRYISITKKSDMSITVI